MHRVSDELPCNFPHNYSLKLTVQFVVKVRAVEVPPPGVGLNTVTAAVPAAAMSAAVIVAVNWVALT
jgi:hypothetical protein